MLDFLLIAVFGIIAFIVGWKLRESYAAYIINRALAEQERIIKNTKYLNIDIHREGSFFYVYNDDNGKFITQVSSRQEMLDYFTEKYPDSYVLMKIDQKDIFLGDVKNELL